MAEKSEFGDRMKLQREALDIATEFENYDNITFSEAADLAWLVRRLFGAENGPRPSLSADDFDD